MKIVLASKNPGKLAELKKSFHYPRLEVVGIDSFENTVEIVEDGSTFEENAIKKALGYADQVGCLTLADDSGLCVDYLSGNPGIYSSRYAGKNKSDQANCEKLLLEMKDCPDHERSASFVAAIALAQPGELIGVVRGTCEGSILKEMTGVDGFGYDPLFFFAPAGMSFAEMQTKEKKLVSHRSAALKKMIPILEDFLNSQLA